jgi:hypothetical protein
MRIYIKLSTFSKRLRDFLNGISTALLAKQDQAINKEESPVSSEDMQADWNASTASLAPSPSAASLGASSAGATAPAPRYSEPNLVRRRPDPFLDNYLKRVDPRIAASFTEEQRRAIRSMFDGRAARRHRVDIRQSWGLGRHRFYFVVLGGRERRLLPKPRAQNALSQIATLAGYLALTGGLLAALAVFVYHLKG